MADMEATLAVAEPRMVATVGGGNWEPTEPTEPTDRSRACCSRRRANALVAAWLSCIPNTYLRLLQMNSISTSTYLMVSGGVVVMLG